MKRDNWDINSGNPAHRVNAVMEQYCDRNSRHYLMGIEPKKYDTNGVMTAFDVLYEITEEQLNDGYVVETHRNEDARNLIQLRLSQGYNVFPVRINNEQTTVVSVRQLPMKEQEFPSGRQR